VTWSRLETSKSLLHIDWTGAVSSIAEQVAHQNAALDELANGDPRPLLLLLDTETTDKKVQALLDSALHSERFTLASKWFHCVRVDTSVLEKDHPYHALYSGKNPARLLLASRDGGRIVRFLGTPRQKVTWAGIVSVLKKDYRLDPTAAVKGIERLLSKFDALDDKQKELQAQLDKAEKNNRLDTVALYRKRIDALDADRTRALARKAGYEELVLRSLEKPGKKTAD
jgi:hypothetical protein